MKLKSYIAFGKRSAEQRPPYIQWNILVFLGACLWIALCIDDMYNAKMSEQKMFDADVPHKIAMLDVRNVLHASSHCLSHGVFDVKITIGLISILSLCAVIFLVFTLKKLRKLIEVINKMIHKLQDARAIYSSFNTFRHYIKCNLPEEDRVRTSCKKIAHYSGEINCGLKVYFSPTIFNLMKNDEEYIMQGKNFSNNLMLCYLPQSWQLLHRQLFYTIYSFSCTNYISITHKSAGKLFEVRRSIYFFFDEAHTGEYTSEKKINTSVVRFSPVFKQFPFNLERNKLCYPHMLQMYY